jgi:RNA polymerase sigma factor (sigma-70 family)
LKSINKYSDEELLKGLLTYDEKILHEFYIRYFPVVKKLILNNNGTEEDAKDLFHDVLLVIFQKLRHEDFRLTCSLKTFLYSIARFKWLRELQKRKRISHEMDDDEHCIDLDADIALLFEYNERMLLYRKVFDELSADCRKVLSLFIEGYSIKEITKIMGYKSSQHTKNRQYRCKLTLINRIRAAYGYKELKDGNSTDD